MRGFVLAGVLALAAGVAPLSVAAWGAIRAVAWTLDHVAWVLAVPLSDAVRVLANL